MTLSVQMAALFPCGRYAHANSMEIHLSVAMVTLDVSMQLFNHFYHTGIYGGPKVTQEINKYIAAID